jgi:hypothetical protein
MNRPYVAGQRALKGVVPITAPFFGFQRSASFWRLFYWLRVNASLFSMAEIK